MVSGTTVRPVCTYKDAKLHDDCGLSDAHTEEKKRSGRGPITSSADNH